MSVRVLHVADVYLYEYEQALSSYNLSSAEILQSTTALLKAFQWKSEKVIKVIVIQWMPFNQPIVR